MRHMISSALCALLICALLPGGFCAEDSYRTKVWKVIDGDSFFTTDGERMRYLGVNAPSPRSPFSNVQKFAEEAIRFNKGLIEGKTVVIKFDENRVRDKQGRLLAYVFLPDGTFANAELIKRGHGKVVQDLPRFIHEMRFIKLQSEARKAKRGIWSDLARRTKVKKPHKHHMEERNKWR